MHFRLNGRTEMQMTVSRDKILAGDVQAVSRLDDYVTAIIKKEIDPYTASEQILASLSKES